MEFNELPLGISNCIGDWRRAYGYKIKASLLTSCGNLMRAFKAVQMSIFLFSGKFPSRNVCRKIFESHSYTKAINVDGKDRVI